MRNRPFARTCFFQVGELNDTLLLVLMLMLSISDPSFLFALGLNFQNSFSLGRLADWPQISRKFVPSQHNALERLASAERLRNRAGQLVVRDIEEFEVGEVTDGVRDGAGQLIPGSQEFLELDSGAQGVGDGAGEAVVGEDKVFAGERADGVGDLARELVVVQEEGIETGVGGEDIVGDGTAELVEAEIEEPQEVDPQYALRERSREFVVAQVDLVEILQLAEIRHFAAEPVVVGMEEGEVSQFVEKARQFEVAS